MANSKEVLAEFFGTAFEELAESDVPGFKQVRGVFNVLRAATNVFLAENGSQYAEHQNKLKKDWRELANKPSTDERKLAEMHQAFVNVLRDSDDAIALCVSEGTLAAKLRAETHDYQSSLPGEFAKIISSNAADLFSPEKWGEENYRRLVAEGVLIRELITSEIARVMAFLRQQDSLREYLKNYKLPAYKDDKNQFHYLNPKIRFRGRRTERRQVLRFLRCNQQIALWGISGQGGVGKSKFARYICDKLGAICKTVWLTRGELEKLNALKSFDPPNKCILFVCDYADEQIEGLKKLIGKLRDAGVQCRFLLLVRDSEVYRNWQYDDDLQPYHYDPTIADNTKMEPLDLSGKALTTEDFKNILEDFRKAYYDKKTLSEDAVRRILERAKQIVPDGSRNPRATRCLFVLLIADAYLNDPNSLNINVDDLMSRYFGRMEEHLENYGCDKNVITSGFRLTAFATMTNGVNLYAHDLPEFIKGDVQEIRDCFNRNKRNMSNFLTRISDGMYDTEHSKLNPYEPDIIGEYLFLWQYYDYLEDPEQRKWKQYILDRMGEEDDSVSPVEAFLTRCAVDWREKGVALSKEVSGFEVPTKLRDKLIRMNCNAIMQVTDFNHASELLEIIPEDFLSKGSLVAFTDYARAVRHMTMIADEKQRQFCNEKLNGAVEQILEDENCTPEAFVQTADTLKNMGYYDKTLEIWLKFAGICENEEEIGKEHPATAAAYNNTAGVYWNMGDYDKALEFLHKAQAIREKVLGTEHPDTATTYNNIGSAYHAMGDYDKALE